LIFSPAVTLEEILDFEAAVHPIFGGGLAVLGTSRGGRILAFRPFPEYDPNGRIISVPPVVPLPCPPLANVVEAGATRNGGTDLYVGGQGVDLITADELANAEDAQLAAVISGEAASEVRDVAVADTPDGGGGVWALLQNGNLLVVTRAAGASDWGTALRLRGDVQEIAPVHGDVHVTTSLLAVYTDGRAATLWQDASSGVWQESPLLVANPVQVARATCFGTSLRVLDEAGAPRVGIPVTVSASVLASVLLNNRTVFLGPTLTVDARTDANGSISLFDRVRSLTPAIYRFDVAGIDGSFDVNPAGGIHERFRTITADDLRGAVTGGNGSSQPLLPERFRTGADRNQVDVVAGALNQVAGLANSASGVTAGVRQVDGQADFSSTLRPETLPDGYRWGLQADANGVRVANPTAIDALVDAAQQVERFFTDLGDSIADFFEGIWARIQEGWTFVLHKAEDAFEFICALGDKVNRFVLKTLEQVGSFFTWLWGQIETGLEQLWNWLKFVFDWDDILLVRDALVDATDVALAHLQDSTASTTVTVSAGFDDLLTQIRAWRIDAGGAPKAPPVVTGTSVLDISRSATAPIQEVIDQATGNSVVAYVLNKLQSLTSEVVRFEGPDPAAEAIEAAKGFVEGLLSDEVSNVVNSVDQLASDLAKIFGDTVPRTDQIDFDTIKNAVITVGADALEGLISAIRDLVRRSLELVATLIGVARDLLLVRIRFPFIEELVKLVTAGAVSIDASFRMMDAMMLLFAVPATIAYKVVAGRAPLSKGDVIAFPYGSVTVQSSVDVFRDFSQVAGFAGAFTKMAFSSFQAYNKAQSTIGGLPVDPEKAWQAWLAAGLDATNLAQEIYGVVDRSSDTEAPHGVLEMEATMVTLSGVQNLKSLAVLIAGERGGEALEKANSGLDVGMSITHFLLRTAVYGTLIDTYRRSDTQESRDMQLSESPGWIESLFDHGGSALVSMGGLVQDPETKGILIVSGAAGNAFAFVLDLVRGVQAIAQSTAFNH
jgi:hypothetical protein